MNTDGSGYKTLLSFGGVSGASPSSGVIQSASGTLYGATDLGGVNGKGTIFKINLDGSGFQKLYDFTTSQVGPRSTLMLGSNGVLFGFSQQGGAYQSGFAFKIQNDGTGFTDYFDIGGANSDFPCSGLTIGTDNLLYGLSSSPTKGSLLQMNQVDPTTVNFFSLTDPVNSTALSDIAQGSDGYWYGTSYFGGTSGNGFLFKIKSDGSSYTKILDFVAATGGQPAGGVVIDANGFLYGTCLAGGTLPGGTVYKIKTDGRNHG